MRSEETGPAHRAALGQAGGWVRKMTAARNAAADTAIERLYRAVSNEAEWPDALTALGKAFDCPRLAIMRATPGMDAVLELRDMGHDPRAKRLYEEYYWASDPSHLLTRGAQLGTWLDAPYLFDPRTTPQPEYMDYAIHSGIRFVAGGKVQQDDNAVTLLGLQRPLDHHPFDHSDAIVFERLHSHIGRAVSLAADLRRAELSRGVLNAALNALESPVFATDGAGKLLMANSDGERSLRECEPFILRNGQLYSPRPEVASRLACALRDAASGRGGAFSANVRGTMWLIRILPLPERPGAALIYASTPQAQPVASSTLASLLNLTKAEAEVAYMLADGLSPKEIAFERDVTLNTIRSQIKSIFEKAGVRRQSDFTKVLFSIPRVHSQVHHPRR